ncbi:uncharacterized protein LOC133320505 [Danaus plexippus]|uniref:uncharacterized protein LOC133320505 n=1 Tax=Danaus plexippus TaxID=13037 RepID=UPI002AAF4E47|nr:uncharacterized protein LOC133320505 [Danaus plexippus]
MFTRTPPKKSMSAEPTAKPTKSAVRKSIDEWEIGRALPGLSRTMISPKTSTASTSAVQKPESPPKDVTPGEKSVYRAQEAKSVRMSAIKLIGQSRNLKTEIKEGILKAVQRLYEIVREAEEDNLIKQDEIDELKARVPEKADLTPVPQKHPDQADQSVLLRRLEEHSSLIKEHMATLKEMKNKEKEKPIVSEPPAKTGPTNEKLEEHAILLRENTESIKTLQEHLKSCQEEVVAARSYAGVTAEAPPPRPIQKALHSVVVTSMDKMDTGEDVLNKIRKTVNAKEGWVKVERVRKAKDQKVVMGFGTQEERKKVKEKIQREGTGLQVEEVKNRDPLLILRGVLSANTDEDIRKALRNQNRDLFKDLKKEDERIEIKYRKRTKNPLTEHVVVSTSPALWNRATTLGALHIDLQRVRVEDQTPLVQCSRCLGYGHSKRFCKEETDACSHCGGPHLRTRCQEWVTGVPPGCRNCLRAKLGETAHNAFSSTCPIRKRWDEVARSAVAYC